MKILVTGHKGFIGSYIANYLTTKDHEVEGFEWIENVVPNVEGYDWVIHCGAISDTTERDVEKVWRQNYEFTLRLLQVCEHYNTNIYTFFIDFSRYENICITFFSLRLTNKNNYLRGRGFFTRNLNINSRNY